MPKRAAQLFHENVVDRHNVLLPRARGITPKIEGSKVTIFGPQFLFRHDLRSPESLKQVRIAVRRLASQIVKEHGGPVKFTVRTVVPPKNLGTDRMPVNLRMLVKFSKK